MTPHTPAAIRRIQRHNRALWLAALRSGRFKQLNGGPIIDDAGRVCAVAGVTGMLLVESGYMTLHGYWFRVTKKWLEAERRWPSGSTNIYHLLGLSYTDFFTLIKANDRDGKSFSEIADLAEPMPYVYE